MKAIDLFSGVGGMSLGFKRAGVDVVLAVDFDWRHVETYNKNFKKDVCIQYDMSSDLKPLQNIINKFDNIDLVFGGPPCQGFSIGGKQAKGDVRNNLIFSYLDIVNYCRPKAFVLENVSGLLQKNYQGLLKEFQEISESYGYSIVSKLKTLNAKDFGVPQDRKRVFIVGVKNELVNEQFDDKIIKYISDYCPTVNDAFKGLEKLEDLLSPKNDEFPRNKIKDTKFTRKINNKNIDKKILKKSIFQKYSRVIDGLMISKHSLDVQKRFKETENGQREPISRYYKLKWKGVAPTLRAGTTRANGQFMAPRPIHPNVPRCITVREAARLHSYPDYFSFYPTKWYGNMQIGNSVPPFLANAVAKSVIELIK